jgi:DNA-binding NarL/FixJ family response regulator
MIRILIADDHAIVRAGLKQLLQDQPDMAVAAEASSGADALAVVRAEDIDVMLLDISMPDRNGIDVLKSARHHKPDLPVLVLSGYPEEQYAINLIRAGAAGYINKEAAPDQLLKAIRTVAAGRRYISARLAEILAEGISADLDRPLHTQLSEREFQVFCRLAAGQALSGVADELCLSVKTVSTYRSRILEKMHMKTNADLTYYAVKNGLIN